VLVAVAVRTWSALVVLGLAILSCLCSVLFFFATAAAAPCGTSTAAVVVELGGAAPLALGLGSWGVRRGGHAFWALPVGWALAGLWIAAAAHVIPGGTGGCFD
jgi:hypothetical protein